MLFLVIAASCGSSILIVLALLVLFEPSLRYQVVGSGGSPESEDFLRIVGALADAQIHSCGRVELLADGIQFYPAELDAISQAKTSVHIEVFIFHPGAIGDRFMAALVDRARNGVSVRIVVDAIGSFPAPDGFFQALREAGGRVYRYQRLGVGSLKRLNNRTHRSIIIVDGNIGFIGGAGIAQHWASGDNGRPPWRDMMFRVQGALVTGLQTAFAENWLESSGEVLFDRNLFPEPGHRDVGEAKGLVVISSPTAGRSTRNRILF